MTSPHSIRWCRKQGHIEARNWVQEAAQFCTVSPSWLFTSYWCLNTEGQPGCNSGLLPPPEKGNGGHWRQWGSLHGLQGSLATDEALTWALHYIKPLLCLNPSRKLWEFALSICWPKSSYSALATLREDGVCIPLHRADILGLVSWREDIRLSDGFGGKVRGTQLS